MCLERLRGLCTAGEEHACVWGSTLVDLGEFVSGLDAPRPPGPCLDTIFVNTEMHDMLFRGISTGNGRLGGDPYHEWERPCQNMAIVGEITSLHHREIPRGCTFAVASAQGPVFVHGPTAISCTEDRLEAFRHCGIEDPPPGSRGCPWGCGFRAVWDKSNALWGSTRYGTGGSAGSAPAFEESASAAMVGAHATPIPPVRPATLPEFRRGAFAPALRICSPAWIVQDPVPPQGPMAEKPRGRALQRTRIVGNPVPL